MSPTITDVSYEPLSDSRTGECVFCWRPAVLEAVFRTERIRCCETAECKTSAAGLAIAPFGQRKAAGQ